jgi:hypothetical protein
VKKLFPIGLLLLAALPSAGQTVMSKTNVLAKTAVLAGVPSAVNWTLVQHAFNFACTGNCTVSTGTSGSGQRALASTTAGNLLVVIFGINEVGGTLTITSPSVSGDTFTHCPTNWPQLFNFNGSNWNATDCWYRLSAAGGATSIAYSGTFGGAGSLFSGIMVEEYNRGSGTATFDAGAVLTNNACTSCTAPTVGMTGTKDVCVNFVAFNQLITAISGSYTNPADFDTFSSLNAIAGALNVVSYSAPSWTSASATNTGAAMGAVCFA